MLYQVTTKVYFHLSTPKQASRPETWQEALPKERKGDLKPSKGA